MDLMRVYELPRGAWDVTVGCTVRLAWMASGGAVGGSEAGRVRAGDGLGVTVAEDPG